MAGSRTEKFRTIFKRCEGLLKSGALPEADKPLWFDVYKRFPPKEPPTYERKVPTIEVKEILYPEDVIRAKYFKSIVNPGPIDLLNKDILKSKSQMFIDAYVAIETEQQTVEDPEGTLDLFAKAMKYMKENKDEELFLEYSKFKHTVQSRDDISQYGYEVDTLDLEPTKKVDTLSVSELFDLLDTEEPSHSDGSTDSKT